MTRGPRTGDAFGALLLDALAADGRPGEVLEIVERDDGHVRVNDAARYFAPTWGALDDWVYERVRGEVLDVGCGAGRNALVLQEAGLAVLALDVSPGAIEVCRRRGVRDTFVGSLEELGPSRRFDTLLLLGNNLGLLGGREQAPRLLERLALLATGPGARILATGVGREPGTAVDGSDREYEERNLAAGRLPWQVTMRSRYRDLATEWFDYLFVRPHDLETLVATGPWRVRDALVPGPAYAVELELVSGP